MLFKQYKYIFIYTIYVLTLAIQYFQKEDGYTLLKTVAATHFSYRNNYVVNNFTTNFQVTSSIHL